MVSLNPRNRQPARPADHISLETAGSDIANLSCTARLAETLKLTSGRSLFILSNYNGLWMVDTLLNLVGLGSNGSSLGGDSLETALDA